MCVCFEFGSICSLKLNGMAVSFPTKLGVTSDVLMKKHWTEKMWDYRMSDQF